MFFTESISCKCFIFYNIFNENKVILMIYRYLRLRFVLFSQKEAVFTHHLFKECLKCACRRVLSVALKQLQDVFMLRLWFPLLFNILLLLFSCQKLFLKPWSQSPEARCCWSGWIISQKTQRSASRWWTRTLTLDAETLKSALCLRSALICWMEIG